MREVINPALKSFSAEFTFTEDVMVSSLMRHTHGWGTDYSVWLAGGARAGEQLWTSGDWEHDVDFRFPEPVLMKAGEGFRFQCAYQNTEDRSLRYGPNATDEMCILLGTWWSTSNAAPDDQICVTTRIGTDGVARPGSVAGFPKPSTSEIAECLRRANERVRVQSTPGGGGKTPGPSRLPSQHLPELRYQHSVTQDAARVMFRMPPHPHVLCTHASP